MTFIICKIGVVQMYPLWNFDDDCGWWVPCIFVCNTGTFPLCFFSKQDFFPSFWMTLCQSYQASGCTWINWMGFFSCFKVTVTLNVRNRILSFNCSLPSIIFCYSWEQIIAHHFIYKQFFYFDQKLTKYTSKYISIKLLHVSSFSMLRMCQKCSNLI